MSGVAKATNEMEELGGPGRETAGNAMEDAELEADGQADQASGNVKQAGEKV